jgi:signal transduction histidine kinase
VAGGVLAELDLDALLQRIVEAARELTGARYAALSVLAEDRRGLSRFVTAGLDDEAHRRIGGRPRGRGLLGEIVVRGEAVRLSDLAAHPRAYGFPPGHPAMRSFLGVPLVVGGTPFGNLYLTERADGDFGAGDEEAARTLAHWAGIAIHNAQRYRELEARREELERERAERLRQRIDAAEEERRRWARELHDETLQGLGALRLSLAAARRAADPDAWRAALDDGVAQLDTEIANVRGIISDVRPAVLDEVGTGAAVEALADRFRSRGIDVALRVDLDYEAGRAPTRHHDELETALYRITQEAMTNALKHSGAESLSVEIAEADGHVDLRVRDEGRGYDPSEHTGGFGLLGMRERVVLLGGRLTVDSAPRAGTTVMARLPVRRRPAASGADRSLASTTARPRRSASSKRT